MLRRSLLLAAVAAVLVAALTLPAWVSPYWLRIATGVFMWAGLACAWNVIGGYAGYISFGHVAFFGIGAYSTGILMGEGFDWPFAATIPVGIAAASLVAVVIGGPTLRLRGAYFAIATWAFAEMLAQLATLLDITGGPAGLSLPPLVDEAFFFYVMAAAAAACYALTWWLLRRSRFGYRLMALRDHELAAQSVGINVSLVKVQAFVLSAAMTALFGCVFAYWVTFINPRSVLGGDITDQMVVMVLVGGLGHLWGPAVGAAVLYLLNRLFWSAWGDTTAYIAILGAAIAGVVLFLPDGLVSLLPRARRTRILRTILFGGRA
ncbi:MAG: branched-chain amino acid ABC transporter permease [Rhodospirillaceae bacterium]|nr:branched-chain amino acid ABC transporter permease [Rhodospirillaceae bacterium]